MKNFLLCFLSILFIFGTVRAASGTDPGADSVAPSSMAAVSLPFLATFEPGSPSRTNFQIINTNGVNDADQYKFYIFSAAQVAYRGEGIAYLIDSDKRGHDDQLVSPFFTATQGVEYDLSFAYRRIGPSATGQIAVFLVNATNNAIVKKLFGTTFSSEDYRVARLLFKVEASRDYKIMFSSVVAPGEPSGGVLIDEVGIKRYTAAPIAATGLVGNANDAECISLTGYGVDGSAFNRIFDATDRLALEIDPNGNNLGDVAVQMTDYSAPPLSPATNTRFLSRHFNVEPGNGPGPYDANGGVKVRLYFTAAELDELIASSGEDLSWEDITILHYSGTDQDCQIENSSGAQSNFEVVTSVLNFGQVYALEFMTTTFSEFGGTSNSAAQGLPVVLRSFGASAQISSNRLYWSVDSEIDFSHYAVERSRDGVVFQEFDRLRALGRAQYSTTDPAPAALQYYRLRMVDFDGSTDYSETVSVSREEVANTELSVYPVPANEEVTLSFRAARGGDARMHLTDVFGRTLRTEETYLSAGQQEYVISLAGLPSATYLITVYQSGQRYQTRLVKQ